MGNIRTTTKSTLNITLALSGGAARGTFHLGFIEALQENGICIKAISGTSAGAIVGGAIACGLAPREILAILQSKEFRAIFKFNWFIKSLFSIDYANDAIRKLFPLQDIKETKIPFYICVTDINAHETIYVDSGSGRDFVMASSSLIPFFEPYYYDGKVLADGGLLELMPTFPLVKHGYPILGINLVPIKAPKKYNFFTSTKRGWELLLNTTVPQDAKRCEWYISPDELMKLKMFSFSKLDKGFELGYKEGLEWCNSQL